MIGASQAGIEDYEMKCSCPVSEWHLTNLGFDDEGEVEREKIG